MAGQKPQASAAWPCPLSNPVKKGLWLGEVDGKDRDLEIETCWCWCWCRRARAITVDDWSEAPGRQVGLLLAASMKGVGWGF